MTTLSGDGALPSDGDLTQAAPSNAKPIVNIGPYRLLKRIGEGGMGDVWLAEQTQPIRRQVALKVIKAGMDTAQVVARFEAERQALALMDHPAIAHVFDAGATAHGRPYFVMEYVRGESITAYCTRHKLDIGNRLVLFLQVCEGVQHAHQKGIIHRDLKPSNVLIALQDDRPAPKIIDFGVAKATTQTLTERTLHTEFGALVGTPEYMSPEQAEMTGLDVDTRTDVYALGVILYELLTGVLPFEAKALREKGLDEIRRTIREVDPPRPSTRVTTLAASADAAMDQRMEATRLASEFRGDLDWITMKALAKDRTRRYGSASDFAADLRRYLDNQPVLASPPSAVYRARKFVRRNRLAVAAAATLTVLLVAFAVTMAVQARRIARERDRANREATRASQEVETARQVSEFLVGLFKASDPREALGETLTARAILDRGAARVDKELAKQPAVQVRLFTAMCDAFYGLGLYRDSESLARKALAVSQSSNGEHHVDTLNGYKNLCVALIPQGRPTEAEDPCRRAADGLVMLLKQDDPRARKAVLNLGALLFQMGRYADAEVRFRQIVENDRRAGSPSTDALNNLAGTLQVEGKLAEAEQSYRQAIEIARRTRPADHPDVLRYLSNLGQVLQLQKKPAEAMLAYREALRGRRRVLPSTHPDIATTLVNLIGLLNERNQFAEARDLAQEALTIREAALSSGDWRIAEAKSLLGDSLRGLRQFDTAEPLLLEGAAGMAAAAGTTSPTGQRHAVERVIALYDAWDKPARAAEWRAKLPKDAAAKP